MTGAPFDEVSQTETPTLHDVDLNVADPIAHGCAFFDLANSGALERTLTHWLRMLRQPITPAALKASALNMVVARGVVCIRQRYKATLCIEQVFIGRGSQ